MPQLATKAHVQSGLRMVSIPETCQSKGNRKGGISASKTGSSGGGRGGCGGEGGGSGGGGGGGHPFPQGSVLSASCAEHLKRAWNSAR